MAALTVIAEKKQLTFQQIYTILLITYLLRLLTMRNLAGFFYELFRGDFFACPIILFDGINVLI